MSGGFWTAPWFSRHPDEPFAMTDFERKTAILSAGAWRRYNGPVYLMTDSHGAAYIRRQKMEDYYDGIWI